MLILMSANITKCVVFIFAKKKIIFDWMWGNDKLLIKDEYVYLGVIFDIKLLWIPHCKKVMKSAGYAFHKLRKFLCCMSMPLRARLMTFRSLIRPIYDYCCETWSVLLTIEFPFHCYVTVSMRLCGVYSLQYWRSYAVLNFVFRLSHKCDELHRYYVDRLHTSTSPFGTLFGKLDIASLHTHDREDIRTIAVNYAHSELCDILRHNGHGLDDWVIHFMMDRSFADCERWKLDTTDVMRETDLLTLCRIMSNVDGFVDNDLMCNDCRCMRSHLNSSCH